MMFDTGPRSGESGPRTAPTTDAPRPWLRVVASDPKRRRAMLSALADEGLDADDEPDPFPDGAELPGVGLLIVELERPSDTTISHWRNRHSGVLIIACPRRTPAVLRRAAALGAEACIDTGESFDLLALVARNLYRLLERLRDSSPWLLDGIAWSLTSPRGQQIRLTRSEFVLLSMVARQPGRVAARETVCEAIGYSPDVDVNRAIDTLVRRLRRKAEQGFGEPLPLRTVRGRGFAFTARVSLDNIA